MRQKLITLILLTNFIHFSLNAQSSLEIGGFMGISNYLGDLQQTNFERNEINMALGFFSRINFNKTLSLKAHFYKGEISGSDANYKEIQSVRERNLSFRSHIFEFGLQTEMTFIWFGEADKRVAAPYLFAGISGFYFNPQAAYKGKWVNLQPLGTEGQTLPNSTIEQYNRIQLSIPLGMGFNINFNQKLNIGFEVGFRKTFTDYLDDISARYPDLTALEAINPVAANLSFRSPEILDYDMPNPDGKFRGNPKGKDLYFFGGITFSTYINKWFRIKKVYKKRKM